jgi:hypothetical protein
MENILDNLKLINQTDTRQQGKTKYPLNEIFGIAFIAMATNADDESVSKGIMYKIPNLLS